MIKKESLQKAKRSTEKFKGEMKKAIVTAITAAFGFLIALAWKDVITEYVGLISRISPLNGKLISALIITAISVLGILLISKLSSSSENN